MEYSIEEHLIRAVYTNQLDIAQEIASVDNFVNSHLNGETALVVAIKLKHLEIFEMLLSQPKLDLNQRTISLEDAQRLHGVQTQLMYAIAMNHAADEREGRKILTQRIHFVNALRKKAFDSSTIVLNGAPILEDPFWYPRTQSALIYAITLHRGAATREERTFYMRRLLESGADVNSRSMFGCTALFECCRYRFLDGVKTLIEFGADCTIESSTELLPFDAAARCCDLDIIEIVFNKTYGALDRVPLKLDTLVALITKHLEFFMDSVLYRIERVEGLRQEAMQSFVSNLHHVPYQAFLQITHQLQCLVIHIRKLHKLPVEELIRSNEDAANYMYFFAEYWGGVRVFDGTCLVRAPDKISYYDLSYIFKKMVSKGIEVQMDMELFQNLYGRTDLIQILTSRDEDL